MSDPPNINLPLEELLERLEVLRQRIDARAARDQQDREIIARVSERLCAILRLAKEAGGE